MQLIKTNYSHQSRMTVKIENHCRTEENAAFGSRQNIDFNIVPPGRASGCNSDIVHTRSYFI